MRRNCEEERLTGCYDIINVRCPERNKSRLVIKIMKKNYIKATAIKSIVLSSKIQISTAKDIASMLWKILQSEPPEYMQVEHFWVILLNNKNFVISISLCSVGSQTSCVVDPRVVFFEAISKRATAIIIAHNHPSGDPTPSEDDRCIYYRIKNCGDILGIKVLDHIIIGNQTEFSSIHDIRKDIK